MLREIRYSKKPPFIIELEKNGGYDYKVYEYQHLSVIYGKENKKGRVVDHITVNSKKRYGATTEELNMIAKELLPKESSYKIKKSFFMKTVSHIISVRG